MRKEERGCLVPHPGRTERKTTTHRFFVLAGPSSPMRVDTGLFGSGIGGYLPGNGQLASLGMEMLAGEHVAPL